ncbi:GreA/GreB family elongation factor [Fibrella sp. HMF5335]|uniref:GreA/GreB family elongation factor n=1 Tax=Fibrella rubiginis TaxID=2817060 RepID=A0A939K0S6_9BACT|nr:GreA/GreB family elongation factor [Fibrella rubiginis]MBO0936412.1 GreA/GreB family elongation factor [Fibrella rubiginis]
MVNRIISKLDCQRLKERVEQAKTNDKISPLQVINLLRGIDAATLLDPVKMPRNVVTMRSVVTLEYVETGRKLDVCLVYPEEADSTQNRISIFAPLATALFGYKQGAIISLPTPFGSVNVRISQILYQPEAAGDLTN